MKFLQNLSQVSGGDGRQYDSYCSPGRVEKYGSYASDGEYSYFFSGGLSINTCDN